jgi:hypothetical protein
LSKGNRRQYKSQCQRENKRDFAHGVFLFALRKLKFPREEEVYTAYAPPCRGLKVLYQDMILQLEEKYKWWSKKRQGMAFQLAEKCKRWSKKRQGTTSVVP